MNFVVVIAALASMASAGVVIIPSGSTLLRRPILDSAVVQSERLGGNFAYAIAEGQSFQRVAPIITRNVCSQLILCQNDRIEIKIVINYFADIAYGCSARCIVCIECCANLVRTQCPIDSY